jgi:O-antigen ligase
MTAPLVRVLQISFGAALIAIVGWFVADFPVYQALLGIGYAAYAIFLWRWPSLWLVVIPALLPVLDLAPLSGRFFFDEFDALILLTVGLLALRNDNREKPAAIYPRSLVWILLLLVISYCISTLVWLWPPPPITPDSFANYYSPYNSLRVAKGFVWAILLFSPLRHAIARDERAKQLLCFGFLIGLFGVGIAALYERWLFPGLLNFNTDYRISSTFSSMHTGDGHIDVWLATTIPLLGTLFIERRRLRFLPLTAALSALALYTLLATSSRAPIIAVLVSCGVGALALLTTRTQRWLTVTIITCLSALALITTIYLPVLMQTSIGQRFAQTGPDATIRLNHWRDALELRDNSAMTHLFGMGLGSFPLAHQERATNEQKAARLQFAAEGSNGFLKLWSGSPTYINQTTSISPQTTYRFSIRTRTYEPGAQLAVALCELWMLYSRNCTWEIFSLHADGDQWQTSARAIRVHETGSKLSFGGLAIDPPTKLSISISNAPRSGVDIDRISLSDMQGHELIRNGEFDQGADYWFWAVDDHLPWHTKNLFVGIWFDQGWLGLLAVSLLIGVTLMTLIRQMAGGDASSAVLLAAMTGFVVTGVTVSTFDQPRLALLFYLMCLMISCKSRQEITAPEGST